MANLTGHPVRAVMPEAYFVGGRFLADPTKTSSSNPCTRTTGRGYIAWRTGQGVYRVRFDRPGARIISATFNIQLATPAARFAQGAAPAESNKAIEFTVVDAAGAAQDLTANDRIIFTCLYMCSGLPLV